MHILKSRFMMKRNEEINLPKTSFLLSRVLHVSLPAAAEVFFIGIIGLADTIMVGRMIGDDALAAVAVTQQPIFITLAVSMGLNAGITAIIARRKGANDRDGANKVLRQATILNILLGGILTIISLLLAIPLLKLARADNDILEMAASYFRIVSCSLIINYIRLTISAAQRACGRTQITLIANVIANIVNVVLNYALIGGNFGFPKLGIEGAAIATVIGNSIACLILLATVLHRKIAFLSIRIFDSWKPDIECIKQIFRISTATLVEQVFMRIGFFLSAAIINSLGTHHIAVYAISSSVMTLSFNITDGFSIGASALVGQSLGEKRKDLAFAYGRLSQIVNFFLGMSTLILIIIFRFPLAQLFSTKAETVNDAAALLLFSSFVIIPQCLQWVTTGILRGAGDTRYTARNSMISIMIVRPLFSWILCHPLGFGLYGAWAGMFLDQALRFILNNIRFENFEWSKIEI